MFCFTCGTFAESGHYLASSSVFTGLLPDTPMQGTGATKGLRRQRNSRGSEEAFYASGSYLAPLRTGV
ncbi:hypothetical protein ACCO45_004714 [Purpureocillium lilacinum]|uniref:Uncharacterized protein n=1 Tax=Purpureocillium lilacinum TaxID=33203 RepID=A0ACC4DUI5_PURLI